MVSIPQTIFLPFDGLFRIWREVYKDNPNYRGWLKRLDEVVSARRKVTKDNRLMVQLTTIELNKMRDLYELEI